MPWFQELQKTWATNDEFGPDKKYMYFIIFVKLAKQKPHDLPSHGVNRALTKGTAVRERFALMTNGQRKHETR